MAFEHIKGKVVLKYSLFPQHESVWLHINGLSQEAKKIPSGVLPCPELGECMVNGTLCNWGGSPEEKAWVWGLEAVLRSHRGGEPQKPPTPTKHTLTQSKRLTENLRANSQRNEAVMLQQMVRGLF